MSEINLQQLQTWVGKTQTAADVIAPAPARKLHAALDSDLPMPETGAALPLLWHWLYFHQHTPTAELSADGHAKRGGFLPPVPLPGRMWAGGRLRFFHPLCIGDEVNLESKIAAVRHKQGRSGALVFVTVTHRYVCGGRCALEEECDLVYRNPAAAPKPAAAPAAASPQWRRTRRPGPVLLFRYSALTFNSHRIHYDRGYCAAEGYPGLVVHGPLIATLLMHDFTRRAPRQTVRHCTYRALRPAFDGAPLETAGRVANGRGELWAVGEGGGVVMEMGLGLG